MRKVLHAVGARPNFVKIAPIVRAMGDRRDRFRQALVYTGQHYDRRMLEVNVDDLGIPPIIEAATWRMIGNLTTQFDDC